MSDAKPLLFIETVQSISMNGLSSGQTFFDSRKMPSQFQPLDNPHPADQPLPDEAPGHLLSLSEQKKEPSKLERQVGLLDRRAKVNHFVLVAIERRDEPTVTGYFKGFVEPNILLESEEGKRLDIPLSSVIEIRILKV